MPYGALEKALKANGESRKALSEMLEKLNGAADSENAENAHAKLAAELAKQLETEPANKVIGEYAQQVKELLSPECKLVAVRSSSNVEDLKKLSGAGLFDSVLNIISSDERGIADAIRNVWESLYSKRAVQSRFKYGIRQELAGMAVLVQEMVASEYSFIAHTSNPVASLRNP